MVTRKVAPDDAEDLNVTQGDHVESLDSIAKLGSQLETTAAAPGQATAEADALADALEIATALELLRTSVVPFAPGHTHDLLLMVWSDKQLQKIAEAIVKLCKHHGMEVGDFFTQYGPYLQLLSALGLPLLATLKILKMPPPQAQADGQQQPA